MIEDSEDASHAFFEYVHTVHNAGSYSFLLQQLDRLFHRFMGKSKCSVMHRNHPLSAKVNERAHSVFRTGVNVAIRSGLISTDRQQRSTGAQAIADLAKAAEVSGIAGVVDRMLAGADHISAEAAMVIAQHARTPMASGDV